MSVCPLTPSHISLEGSSQHCAHAFFGNHINLLSGRTVKWLISGHKPTIQSPTSNTDFTFLNQPEAYAQIPSQAYTPWPKISTLCSPPISSLAVLWPILLNSFWHPAEHIHFTFPTTPWKACTSTVSFPSQPICHSILWSTHRKLKNDFFYLLS